MPDSKTPEIPDTRAKFQVLIQGALEDVWHEITRTDSPIPAFFNSRMDAPNLTPGAPFAMRSSRDKYTGVVGKILEFDMDGGNNRDWL